MSKTLTVRMDDATYRLVAQAAAADNRSMSNFIETAARQRAVAGLFVPEEEMAVIRSDRRLQRRLKAGHRDAAARRGRFANSRSSARSSRKVKGYVVCVTNAGYPASLEVRKLYEYLEALPNDPKSRIRVVDESGEDYLYPRAFFRRVALPRPIRQALIRSNTAA